MLIMPVDTCETMQNEVPNDSTGSSSWRQPLRFGDTHLRLIVDCHIGESDHRMLCNAGIPHVQLKNGQNAGKRFKVE
jgi:hypothetical protein